MIDMILDFTIRVKYDDHTHFGQLVNKVDAILVDVSYRMTRCCNRSQDTAQR